MPEERKASEVELELLLADSIVALTPIDDVLKLLCAGSRSIGRSVEFTKVTDEVRQRVDQTRANLPREIDPPQVQRLEIDSSPIMTYAVSSPDMSASDLSWFVDDTVSRSLQGEKGVAQVSRVGGVDREINVVVDPVKAQARHITAEDVAVARSTSSSIRIEWLRKA